MNTNLFENYEGLKPEQFAWEFLRRNEEYKKYWMLFAEGNISKEESIKIANDWLLPQLYDPTIPSNKLRGCSRLDY